MNISRNVTATSRIILATGTGVAPNNRMECYYYKSTQKKSIHAQVPPSLLLVYYAKNEMLSQ